MSINNKFSPDILIFLLFSYLALPPYGFWFLGIIKFYIIIRDLEITIFRVVTVFLWNILFFTILFIGDYFFQSGRDFLLLLSIVTYISLYYSVCIISVKYLLSKFNGLAVMIFIYFFEFLVERSGAVFPLYMGMELSQFPVFGGIIISHFGVPFLSVLSFAFSLIIYKISAEKGRIIFVIGVLTFLMPFGFKPFASDNAMDLPVRFVQKGLTNDDYEIAACGYHAGEQLIESYLAELDYTESGELVVLPEGVFLTSLDLQAQYLPMVRNKAIEKNIRILANVIVIDEKGHMYNSLSLIDETGQDVFSYYKRNPAPISESEYKSGDEMSFFTISDKRIGTLICYDNVFFRNYKELKDVNVDLVIVVSNDYFTEKTVIPYVHSFYSRLYSMRFHLPVLYVSQNGPSAFYHPDGSVSSKMKGGEEGVKVIHRDN